MITEHGFFLICYWKLQIRVRVYTTNISDCHFLSHILSHDFSPRFFFSRLSSPSPTCTRESRYNAWHSRTETSGNPIGLPPYFGELNCSYLSNVEINKLLIFLHAKKDWCERIYERVKKKDTVYFSCIAIITLNVGLIKEGLLLPEQNTWIE